MGGRGSDVGSNTIAFIHGSDGESWARFLQKLLRGPDYNIESSLYAPNHPDTPQLFSKTQTCAVLVSPSMLEVDYTDFWNTCLDCFHSRTVVLLLGVDANDLRGSLGDRSNRVLHQKWLEVDGTRDAVSAALVKLIEAFEAVEHTSQTSKSEYEDDEDVYDRPPPPRQQNGLVRIVPPVLHEQNGHEVVIVLERQADGDVALVTEGGGGPSRHIPMTHITGTAYSAELNKLRGTVGFKVMSGDQILGEGSVLIRSRTDQLADLLHQEVSPLALMCSAMGLSPARRSDAEELDVALASRLSGAHLPLGLTSLLMPDEQSTTDEHNSRWPTLLHFAAEYNLSKLCEELLKYPSMIHAAVTENKEGLYPCQLAEKHGYTALQQRLLQYVEDMRLRSAADSGVSFENFPAPSPHSSTSHMYVNDPAAEPSRDSLGEFDDSYVDMSGFPTTYISNGEVFTRLNSRSQGEVQGEEFPDASSKGPLPPPLACNKIAGYGYAKPRSYSDGNVKTPYARQPTESMIKEEDDSREDGPPPLKPKLGSSRSFSVCYTSSSRMSRASAEKSENDTDSSGDSAPETLVSRLSTTPVLRDSYLDQSSSRPSSHTSSGSTQSDYEVPPHQDSETSDIAFAVHSEEAAVMRTKHSKRNKTVQDKISHFFKKIKPRRQHTASESEGSPTSSKSGKKTVFYKRQSTSSSSSDPTTCPSLKKSDSQRSSSSASYVENERDSGAVCDDHGSPVLLRSRGGAPSKSKNSGKNGSATVDRRQSVRVQKAKKEEINETPTLPSRGSSRQSNKGPTFVSYMP